MLEKNNIQNIVEEKIIGTELFIVDIKIDTANNISVFLDGDNGISIDQCVDISRHIENELDREVEDFALEVSSAGIGQDFKVHRQYLKAVGKTISVLFKDGIKIEGILKTVDNNGFEIAYEKKEKPEGAKRPKIIEKQQTIMFSDVKSVKEIIQI